MNLYQVVNPHIAKIDETAYWMLGEDQAPYVKQIFSLYCYDENQATYCCEMTPSRWLHWIDTVFAFTAQTPDYLVEQIESELRDNIDGDGLYMHVNAAEAVTIRQLEPVPYVDYETTIDEIIEDIRAKGLYR